MAGLLGYFSGNVAFFGCTGRPRAHENVKKVLPVDKSAGPYMACLLSWRGIILNSEDYSLLVALSGQQRGRSQMAGPLLE